MRLFLSDSLPTNKVSVTEMNDTVYLTADGLQELKDELHRARTVERKEIADAIAEARAQGDLSENAEYDAAKEAQGHLEARIAELEKTFGNARVLDDSQVDTSAARILSRVKVKNTKARKEFEYTLVSAREANLREGKISVDSPIGKALLGRRAGDTVDVRVPAGDVKLRVLEISR